MSINGDVTTKVGNSDPLEWTLVDEYGNALDITAAVSAKLRLKNIVTGIPKEFSSEDNPQKFTFNTTTSKCVLTPAITDFVTPAAYKMDVVLYDGVGNQIIIPGDTSCTLRIVAL